MAKLLWGLLCERVIIDRETNTSSHIEVIEDISVESFPIILPRASLALMWRREGKDEEFQLRILVNWPGASEVITINTGKLAFEKPTNHFNLTLANVKIEAEGELTFEVKQMINGKWKKVDKFSYPIVQIERQSTEQI